MCRVRISSGVLMVAGFVALTGCSKTRVPVSGTITVGGSPMDFGSIVFAPEDADNGYKMAGRIMDGTYSLDATRGLYPGRYKVEIRWHKKTGKQVTGTDGETLDEFAEGLPPKYHTRTELTAEIGSWSNQVDFNLSP
jgi:hypothetical protein